MEHSEQIVYFKKPILCSYCSDYLWGVQLYGIQCSRCFKCFHPPCFHLSTTPCDEQPPSTTPLTSSSPIPLSSWSVADVGDWMAVVSLHRYYEHFKKYEVDGDKLETLTREQIQSMHIKDSFHTDSIIIASDVLKHQQNIHDGVMATEVTPSNHSLSTYSFTSLQQCHVCGCHLLGIIQQGYQCRVCGLCCHRRCRVLQLPACREGCVSRRDSFIQDSLFGKSLDDFNTIPPPVVTFCTQELQHRASNQNVSLLQFYRQTPYTQNVLNLKEDIIQNASDVFSLSLSNHASETIGGIVKKFLRDLPEPVVPESFYADFISIINEQLSPSQSKALLSRLPSTHYLSIEHLINHLTSDNDSRLLKKIARIFGNILLRPPWNQIMDIVHNSELQNQTIYYLMTHRNVLFTREQHQVHQQQLTPNTPDIPPKSFSPTSPTSLPIAHQPWYFGDTTREEVDDLMMTASDGSFLVRNAASWDPFEPYTLTLRKNGTNKLIKISKVRDHYGLSRNPPLFPSVHDLIIHYSTHSLATFHRSLDITLRHPLTRERLSEQHSIVDLQKLRGEFKDLCSASTQLMGEMEALNSEYDTLADLVRVYENNNEAIKKVIQVYDDHLEMSRRFMKERACNKEMKRCANDGQCRMERKKEVLTEELVRVQRETMVAKKRLAVVEGRLEEMKEMMVQMDKQKEVKKRALLELDETESNIELLQSGGDVQKNLPHHQVSTWLVRGERRRAHELLEGRPSGTFLIRPREEEHNHALSIVSQTNEVVHCVIEQRESGFGFTEPYFIHPTLLKLVLHYKDTSLKEHNDTLDVTLDHPVLAR